MRYDDYVAPNSKYFIENEADLLEAAAEEIEINGWTTGTMRDGKGVCAVGAISLAQYNTAFALECHRSINPLAEKALNAFIKHLNLKRYERSYNAMVDEVTAWNDKDCFSKEEVVDTLRKIAKLVREGE